MREMRREFARELDGARKARGLSIREVARIAGVPAATAQGWLNGRHFPVAALRPQYLKIVDEFGLRDRLPDGLWDQGWSAIRPALSEAHPPYLGLRPFGVADAALFFGRATESARIAQAVLDLHRSDGKGVVVVVGASGSGKSSLLAAGLVAGECTEGLLAGWEARLVTSVAGLTGIDGDPDVVVVDQFEDILLAAPAERATAIEAMARLAAAGIVVVGLRSDAFAEAMAEPLLAAALSRPVLVAPLTRAELREVIEGPAELSGAEVDEELVHALELELAPGPVDAAVSIGVLPLLSNALLVTWATGDGHRMSLADYQATGGVSAAIESLAEDVFGTLTEDQQRATETLFLRLVRPAGENVVRESLPLAAVEPETAPVLEAFVEARMLTLADGTVRISHDALIAGWSRLGEWVERSREDLEVLTSVQRAAQVWVDSERDEDALIPVQRLALFSAWLADPWRQRLLGATEREYLAASDAHFDSVLQAERRASARLRRRGRLAIGLAAIVTVLAVVAAGLYVQAQSARAEAQSRQVAVMSRSLRSKDPNLLTQLAAVSSALAPTQESASALVDATSMDAPLRWSGAPSGVLAVSSAAGLVARGDGAGGVTLWRGADLDTTPGARIEAGPAGSAILALALGQVGDRTLLAVGGQAVRAVWDVTGEPRLLADLRDDDATATAVAFAPAGTTVLFGAETGEIVAWDVTDPESPRRDVSLKLDAATDGSGVPAVTALAAAPNGVLYVGGQAGAISRWRLDGAQPVRLPDLSSQYIPTGGTELASVRDLALAVSPDGRHLAAGQAGRATLTWQLSGTEAGEPVVLRNFSSYVNAVAYSEDSSRLIAGSSDQYVSLYDSSTGVELRRMTNPAILAGVALLAGRPVAVGTDGTLRVWPAQVPVLRAAGMPASYNIATDATADGWLAAGNSYDPSNLWRVTNGTIDPVADPQVTLPGDDAQRGAIAVASAGDYLIGGSEQGRVIRWPLTPAGAGTPQVVETELGYVATAKISRDGRLVAAVEEESGSRVVLLRADGGLSVAATIPAAGPRSAAFTADSSILAVALSQGPVQLWSVAEPSTPTLVGAIEQATPEGTHLAASPVDALLAIGDGNGIVSVWDLSDPADPVKVREFTDPASEIYSVDFSPDGRHIVAAAGDDLIWSWELTGDDQAAAFVLDGGFGRPWDARYIDDGRRIAATGGDGEIKVWAATPELAKPLLCANRGQPLTEEEWARYLPGVAASDPC